jgi:hypothetical protein
VHSRGGRCHKSACKCILSNDHDRHRKITRLVKRWKFETFGFFTLSAVRIINNLNNFSNYKCLARAVQIAVKISPSLSLLLSNFYLALHSNKLNREDRFVHYPPQIAIALHCTILDVLLMANTFGVRKKVPWGVGTVFFF